MVMLWAFIVVTGLAIALAVRRHPPRHRYFDSAAWNEQHWREEHEKARVARERMWEDYP